jgi:hypothetical protein
MTVPAISPEPKDLLLERVEGGVVVGVGVCKWEESLDALEAVRGGVGGDCDVDGSLPLEGEAGGELVPREVEGGRVVVVAATA